MGDSTNLTVAVKGVRPEDQEAVEQIITDGEGNDYGTGWQGDEGDFGCHYRSVGAAESVFDALIRFMDGDPADEARGFQQTPCLDCADFTGGGTLVCAVCEDKGTVDGNDPLGRPAYDFAVLAYQDPIFDALWLFCHVPGVGTVRRLDCDADGHVVVRADVIYDLAENADDLLAALEAHTGHTVTSAFNDYAEATTTPTDANDCYCVFSCDDDPATACSQSGRWHTHPQDAAGVFGPCPAHPDAPGDT